MSTPVGTKVFISMMEHIGDIVACEPAARLVKAMFPGCILYWVTSRKFASLVKFNPYIDAVVELECLGEWARLQANLNEVVFDLNVNHKVCAHCGVQLNKRQDAHGVDCTNWYDHGPLLPTFLKGAGLPAIADQPRFWLQKSDLSIDARYLGRRLAVIHPKSTDVQREWTLDRWAGLTAWLRLKGFAVLEVGLAASGIPGVEFFNSQDFQEIANLINTSDVFIGIDSGFAHFANALEIPSVILLGKFRHWENYTPYTGTFHARSRIVRPFPLFQGKRTAEIEVDAVCKAVLSLDLGLA